MEAASIGRRLRRSGDETAWEEWDETEIGGRYCNGDGLKIQLPLPPVHLGRLVSDGRLSFFVGTVLV